MPSEAPAITAHGPYRSRSRDQSVSSCPVSPYAGLVMLFPPEDDGNALVVVDHRGRVTRDLAGDLPSGEALGQPLECDAHLGTPEGRADAAVQAPAEREMLR